MAKEQPDSIVKEEGMGHLEKGRVIGPACKHPCSKATQLVQSSCCKEEEVMTSPKLSGTVLKESVSPFLTSIHFPS